MYRFWEGVMTCYRNMCVFDSLQATWGLHRETCSLAIRFACQDFPIHWVGVMFHYTRACESVSVHLKTLQGPTTGSGWTLSIALHRALSLVLLSIAIRALASRRACAQTTEGGMNAPLGVLVSVLWCALATMLVWSYLATVMTDAGTVPAGWQPVSERAGSGHGSSSADRTTASPRPLGARWCKRCLKWKPDRCHHCSVCGRCGGGAFRSG